MRKVVRYGCYLEMKEHVVDTDMSLEVLQDYVYDLAYECTENHFDTQGFNCECGNLWISCCYETIDYHCEYRVDDYDAKEYSDLEVLKW